MYNDSRALDSVVGITLQPSVPAFSPARFVDARPASHAVQLVALVTLFVDEPAAHSRQSFSSACGAYLPGGHDSQVCCSVSANSPALHAPHAVRSLRESWPAGHLTHVDAPGLF